MDIKGDCQEKEAKNVQPAAYSSISVYTIRAVECNSCRLQRTSVLANVVLYPDKLPFIVRLHEHRFVLPSPRFAGANARRYATKIQQRHTALANKIGMKNKPVRWGFLKNSRDENISFSNEQ